MSLEPWIEFDRRRTTYVVRWRDASGKKHTDEFRYNRATEAKERQRIVRQKLIDKSLGRVDTTYPLKDLQEKFIDYLEDSGSTKGVNAAAAFKYLPIETLGDLTRPALLNYMTSLQAKKLSDNTVQSYMGIIRRWITWLMDNEYLLKNPLTLMKVPTPKKIDRYFTEEELLALEIAIDDKEFLAIFCLGYGCGLRPGEIFRLTYDMIRWDAEAEEGELCIPPDETKTKSGGRFVPLPAEIYHLIPQGKERPFGDWGKQRLKRHWHKAKARAHIQDKIVKDRVIHKTFYWTRHTYAKRYLERGGNLKVLADRMGHATIQMTADVYGHLERSAIKDIKVPLVSAGQMQGKQGENRGII